MTPTSTPDVTVVVAAYNAMPYLTECLESIRAQSIPPERVEVVAVDDGSTDGTGEELESFAELLGPRVRVVHQENSGGPAAPRNTALDLATARYVFFLDADDRLGPEALQRMVESADRNGSDVVLGKVAGLGGRRVPRSMFRRNVDRTDVYSSRVYWTLTPMKLFRRALVERLGLRFPTDLPVGEDQPFCARAYLHAANISVVADHVCLHWRLRDDGGNITTTVTGAEPRVRMLTVMLDLVAGELPPGAHRDHLLRRHLTLEMHRALVKVCADGVGSADRQRLLGEMRDALSAAGADRAARRLPAYLRLEYHLLLHGRYAALVSAMAHLRDELAHQGRDMLPAGRGLFPVGLVRVGGRVYARYPGFRDPASVVPDHVFDVTRELEYAARAAPTASPFPHQQRAPHRPHRRNTVKNILIRSGKSPFHVTTPQEYIQQDLLGTNAGNLLFSDAAHRLLLTPGTRITSNGIRTVSSAQRAAEINEQYDVFVVPLANAFRLSFEASLNRLSKLIEQLTIPVVVLGVGAQVPADYDTSSLSPMEGSVKRFMKAVLKRSASIGVRGELTAGYLRELGFDEVDIIGCPSMFLYGDTFPELDNSVPLTDASRIAVNISHGATRAGDIAGIARHVHERFPNLMYYAQNLSDAELLFWGDTSVAAGREAEMPELATHPLLRENKVRVPIDPSTWIAELREYDFAFGTRIHGNIAALLAGVPSVVLCHDSRTLELCRYFDIPHRMLQEVPADCDPAELYAKADFSALHDGHRERFERFTAFLDRNGLENTYTHGDGGAAFDARLAGLDLPESIGMWNGSDDGALGYRIAWLREQAMQAKHRQNAAVRGTRELAEENERLQERLAAVDRRTAALEKRVDGIDRRVTVRLGPALRRRARRLMGR